MGITKGNGISASYVACVAARAPLLVRLPHQVCRVVLEWEDLSSNVRNCLQDQHSSLITADCADWEHLCWRQASLADKMSSVQDASVRVELVC